MKGERLALPQKKAKRRLKMTKLDFQQVKNLKPIGLGEQAAKRVWEFFAKERGVEKESGTTYFINLDFKEGDCEFEIKIQGDTAEITLVCIHYGYWGNEENWGGKNLPSVGS